MKGKIITLILAITSTAVLAQENKFSHCNCTEMRSEDSYKVESDGIEVESGQFKNDKRTGLWQSKNSKGIIIRKANYTNGKLTGLYELFHFDGSPKLIAEFERRKTIR